jgi:hypothetical protein
MWYGRCVTHATYYANEIAVAAVTYGNLALLKSMYARDRFSVGGHLVVNAVQGYGGTDMLDWFRSKYITFDHRIYPRMIMRASECPDPELRGAKIAWLKRHGFK